MRQTKGFSHLERIFRAGLDRVDPYRMIMDRVRLSGSRLVVQLEGEGFEVDLGGFRQIFVLGAGKAAAKMAKAIEEVFEGRIDKGCIVVKYGHTEPLSRLEIMVAGHPVPDESGVAAAKRILSLADEADAETLVITLISGGGSALLPSPLDHRNGNDSVALNLSDKQETTKALLACGADIEEINCLRKHLSGLKGGRLLQRMAPARSLNFILSDVVGDDLSSIASGMTVCDPSTFQDALRIVEKYGIAEQVPERVLRVLRMGRDGKIPETLKKGAAAEGLAANVLVGTNRTAVYAAGEKAKELGYNLALLTSRITGEAREVAKFLAGIAKDIYLTDMLVKKPACVISGGEPVVTVRGSGLGGRNQEMALAFLAEMQRRPTEFQGVYFLAASTDGNDGPTDAAGAFVGKDTLEAVGNLNMPINDYLDNNDSYHFFERTGGLFKTGPTNTNVCDLHILLILD